MIWYEIPYGVSLAVMITALLAGILQSVAALEASELLHPLAVQRVRLHYGLLTLLSTVLLFELILAVSSAEGGIYLSISRVPRLVALLPPLHGIWCRRHPLRLPDSLRPAATGYWLPLLCLPLEFFLPSPLAALLNLFALTWFGFDAAHTLLTFQTFRRSELTRSIIPHMLSHIDYGLCVANSRGWIIETNPAFTTFCNRLGLPAADHVSAFDRVLNESQALGRLEITDLGSSLAIRQGDASFSLRRHEFRTGRRSYTQLSLTDATLLTQASRSLESDNQLLAERNRELERVIDRLGEEEAVRERERLCRMAHDAWSQQLAIAGLMVDMLIRQNDAPIDAAKLAECGALLAIPGSEELNQLPGDLDREVNRMTGIYKQLGVTTIVTGQVQFTPAQEEALKPVLREAFANAVRHAYARTIEIRYFTDDRQAGLEICNDTLDNSSDITEGRGLHDIRARVSQAGGSVKCSKKTRFSLLVTFDRNGEEDAHENRSD